MLFRADPAATISPLVLGMHWRRRRVAERSLVGCRSLPGRLASMASGLFGTAANFGLMLLAVAAYYRAITIEDCAGLC